ncbi:MAG: DUF3332 family protein [Deltaproteobacteria bacterium]|nr:DUF3332 family protein [Deltaproteobacteria bacterium]
MRTNRFGKVVALLLVVSLGAFATGCFGKFQLTRKVYDINKSIDEKYVRSAVTWIFVIVPVYGIAALLDFLIFNTIEFWSGDNPVTSAPVTKTYAQGDGKAVLTLSREGEATVATVERYEGDALVSTLRIRDDGRGKVTAVESAAGVPVREIAAVPNADGSVDVTVATADGATTERHAASSFEAYFARVARIASEVRQAAGASGAIPLARAATVPAFGG